MAAKLGARARTMGDFLAFRFQALPRIPLLLVLGRVSEEFEPMMLIAVLTAPFPPTSKDWTPSGCSPGLFPGCLEACAKAPLWEGAGV